MGIDSTNINEPWFGPGLPVYPHLPQLLRVYQGPIPGSKPAVYPSYVQQYNNALGFRDREPAYVFEPNGIALGPGIYDTRLVGSYAGQPLFATHCCATGSLSSSSSASLSSGFPVTLPSILRTGLDVESSLAVSYLRTVSLSVPLGAMLLAVVSVVGSTEGVEVRFGGETLDEDLFVDLPVGAALAGSITALSSPFCGGQTNNLLIMMLGGVVAAAIIVEVVAVTGLSAFLPDAMTSASGLASTPDAGVTGALVSANEYAQGGFLLITPGGVWTWANSFTSGGQDASITASGVAVSATEGSRVVSTAAAVHPKLAGVTPAAWAGLGVTYY